MLKLVSFFIIGLFLDFGIGVIFEGYIVIGDVLLVMCVCVKFNFKIGVIMILIFIVKVNCNVYIKLLIGIIFVLVFGFLICKRV